MSNQRRYCKHWRSVRNPNPTNNRNPNPYPNPKPNPKANP